MDLVRENVNNLSIYDIFNLNQGKHYDEFYNRKPNTYKLILSLLVYKSYANKEIIIGNNYNINDYFRYLGYYLCYISDKNEENITNEIMTIIKPHVERGCLHSVYQGYVLGIKEEDKIDKLVYFINITDDIYRIYPRRLASILAEIDKNILVNILDRCKITIEPIEMIKEAINYIIVEKYKDYLLLITGYYINKGEITFDDIKGLIRKDSDRKWLESVMNNQV